jgi:hypothetical protein
MEKNYRLIDDLGIIISRIEDLPPEFSQLTDAVGLKEESVIRGIMSTLKFVDHRVTLDGQNLIFWRKCVAIESSKDWNKFFVDHDPDEPVKRGRPRKSGRG